MRKEQLPRRIAVRAADKGSRLESSDTKIYSLWWPYFTFKVEWLTLKWDCNCIAVVAQRQSFTRLVLVNKAQRMTTCQWLVPVRTVKSSSNETPYLPKSFKELLMFWDIWLKSKAPPLPLVLLAKNVLPLLPLRFCRCELLPVEGSLEEACSSRSWWPGLVGAERLLLQLICRLRAACSSAPWCTFCLDDEYITR